MVGRAPTIVESIAAGTLDAELAALLWLLVEGGVPLLVAGAPGSGRTATLDALLYLVPPTVERRVLAGAAEDFRWLPDAARLGWRRTVSGDAEAAPPPAGPARTILIVGRLGEESPTDSWGEQARVVIRTLSLGYALGGTIRAGNLEAALAALREPPVALTDDELSHIGVVLVLRQIDGDAAHPPRRRIVAAHYVRPLARDAGGHLQRLGPAVLATWDDRRDAFEHFAWGVLPELAGRVGRRPGDFEAEHARRAAWLAGLVAAGTLDPASFRRAFSGFAVSSPGLAPPHR